MKTLQPLCEKISNSICMSKVVGEQNLTKGKVIQEKK